MESRAPTMDSQRPVPNEVEGLKRALDRAYASLRERAYAEWQYRYGGMREPADSSVSVRVTGANRYLGDRRLDA